MNMPALYSKIPSNGNLLVHDMAGHLRQFVTFAVIPQLSGLPTVEDNRLFSFRAVPGAALDCVVYCRIAR